MTETLLVRYTPRVGSNTAQLVETAVRTIQGATSHPLLNFR